MLIFGLVMVIILLLAALVVMGFYLIRFATIIFSIEDKLENALETLQGTQTTLDNLVGMKLFFDSKEVKIAVEEALSSVKQARSAIVSLINDFTRLSKEKYITVRSDEEDIEEEG